MPTTPTPNVLTDPGYLFWSPLGTAEPTNTVTASKFSDAWGVAWIPLGATEEGSTFANSISVEPIAVAEFFDPIKYATTERTGNFAFALADITLANIKRAFNGGALSVVSGTGATQLNKYEPPNPGEEVRCMLGWESLDNTMRIIVRQTINAAEIGMAFQKAPAKATLACQFNFEKPVSAQPWAIYTAGAARA